MNLLSQYYKNLGIDENRNFKEDYSHENGKYINTCHKCYNLFVGHKHRVRCKLCLTQSNKQL